MTYTDADSAPASAAKSAIRDNRQLRRRPALPTPSGSESCRGCH